jgi:two-component system phosphate regulon sensor histidine kinase PhoR
MPARSWKYHIGRLILSAALVLAAGWFAGYPVMALALAFAGYTVWHIFNAWRLFLWLQNSADVIPESFGLWADIFDTLSSREQRKQTQKEQYSAVIGEFQGLTDAFPDATLVINENDQITWFNDAASSLLGLKIPTDLGQAVTNLLRGPDFADWLAIQGEVKSRLEMRSPRSDTTWLSVSAVSFRDNQRLIILGDISDVHQLDQIRRDFVENISHELRTPLTVLLGYLELLQKDPSSEMSDALEKMHDQALQMKSMLNDLQELSRLQSDKMHRDEEIVNIPAILARLRERAEELSLGRHELLFDADASLYLSGIASDIESAFGNLINNALRYTPQGGTISVNWSDTPEGPLFIVRDTGIGIPKREIPRLTERFYRVGSDRARHSGGTGLGLSIVKHVLNAHHARLRIYSELGEGSEFACVFPPDRKRDDTSF